jgi:hypothetical protein
MSQNMNPSRPNSPPSAPPLSLQDKHVLAQQKVERFGRMLNHPRLSPGAAELALNMHRSAKAELALSEKALRYAEPHPDPEVEKKLTLYRSLHLPLPTSPSAASPSTSDETGTSAPRTSPQSPSS